MMAHTVAVALPRTSAAGTVRDDALGLLLRRQDENATTAYQPSRPLRLCGSSSAEMSPGVRRRPYLPKANAFRRSPNWVRMPGKGSSLKRFARNCRIDVVS